MPRHVAITTATIAAYVFAIRCYGYVCAPVYACFTVYAALRRVTILLLIRRFSACYVRYSRYVLPLRIRFVRYAALRRFAIRG